MLISSDNSHIVQPSPIALDQGERWYAVHTLPFAEVRAEAQLQNQNFRTFLPKRYKTVRHARSSRTIAAPFFPRYFFIILNIDQRPWRCVNGTIGVSTLVMQGDQPQPVPRGIVEALLACVGGDGVLQLDRDLRVGEPVRLMIGPFAEQLAVIDKLDDTGRVQVLLDILGRKVSISTEASYVLPVSPV
jgi:transcriptional antiterminator RfaH